MEYTTVTPEVVSLDARVHEGILVVELELSDPATQLPDNVRIPVTARSSSEDAETVLVRPVICQDAEFGPVFCGQFGIGIEQNEVDSLAARLRKYGAFIRMELREGVSAYFPYGTIAEILDTVGRWPGVLFVEPLAVLYGAGSLQSDTLRLVVRGYMRIEATRVTPGNDFLEAKSLDVLRVEYAPRTGALLATNLVLH